MSAFDGGEDRFSLLLLEDGEYYFRDYNCHFWKHADQRVAGQLKVCSASLFFVPRDVQEPILRLPHRTTSSIARSDEDRDESGEDVMKVCAVEKVEMKFSDRNAPYKRTRGEATYLFSLVYTSLGDILPRIKELWALSRKDDTKEGRLEAKKLLAEIIQEHEANERFNPGWLEDENERVLLEVVGSCITPLCSQPGRLVVTSSRIYFQPFNVVSNNPIQTYQMDQIKSVVKRTYQLRPTGLEVFFSGRNSLYLTFRTSEERGELERTLKEQPAVKLQSQRSPRRWQRDWVNGKVSNFDYLMYLNRQSGRSFQDVTQYPVFPWVVRDYTSANLDLTNPATFRDLSKPVGALNPARLADFRERYRELRRMCHGSTMKLAGSPPPLEFPPFLYGCHYSTPGYVVYYLMRSDPQLMLRLQNGRFDAPDRLFWSILDTWTSVTSLSADVKELIPEFYSTDPSFLLNLENINFGTRSGGQEVGDLELPPWASDAQEFVQKLAEALESPLVSASLHRWIDLIFGRSSRGRKAEEADNVFYYLTYDDIALSVLAREKDTVMREALRVQMVEFGRTPQQLFTKRHPRRRNPTGRSKLPAFCCGFKPSPTPQVSHPSRNILRASVHKRKSARPVAKAVARLTSSKPFIRQATLAWLEQAASRQEPEFLALPSHTDLLGIVKLLRENCGQQPAQAEALPSPQAEDLPGTFVRALRVLAIAPSNRPLILEAGALDPLAELLCTQPLEEVEAALYSLSLLSHAEDPRLNAFPTAALDRLLALLANESAASELRGTAAATLANLSRTLQNRSHISAAGGLEVCVGILRRQAASEPSDPSQRESPRVVREAAGGLLALLEDDSTKLQARGALPLLIALCSQPADNDVRAVCLRCIAAFSMHPDLQDDVLEAVPLLCRLAKLRGMLLQVPVAAALANICSNAGLHGREDTEECFAALYTLSQSGNAEVQRHVARALWHLATAEESRHILVQKGGLTALQRLLEAPDSRGQSRTLAHQALRRIAEDQELRGQLPAEVLTRLEDSLANSGGNLQALLLSPGRSREVDGSVAGLTPSRSISPLRRIRQPSSPARGKRKHIFEGLERLTREASGGSSASSSGWLEGGEEGGGDGKSLTALLNRLGFKRSPQPTPAEDRETGGYVPPTPTPDTSLRKGDGNGVIHLPPLAGQTSLSRYASTSSARASFGEDRLPSGPAREPTAAAPRHRGSTELKGGGTTAEPKASDNSGGISPDNLTARSPQDNR